MEAWTYSDPQIRYCGPYDTDDKPAKFYAAHRDGMAHVGRIWAQQHMSFGSAMAEIDDRKDYYNADTSDDEDVAFAAALEVTYMRSVAASLATDGPAEHVDARPDLEIVAALSETAGAISLQQSAVVEYAA